MFTGPDPFQKACVPCLPTSYNFLGKEMWLWLKLLLDGNQLIPQITNTTQKLNLKAEILPPEKDVWYPCLI
jgi:hypothetical protein